MNAPGLFVPTYGKSEAAGRDSAAKQKASRVLPSKPIAPQPKPRPSSLSSLVFNGNIEYIQTWEAADQAGRALEAARPGVLGFDIEWQVSFVKGQAPAPTATLQLCAPERPEGSAPTSVKSSPVWGTAFIFHLFHMRRHPSGETPSNWGTAVTRVEDKELASGGSRCSAYLPESVVRVLSDPGVLLAGVGVNGDVCRLERDYEQLRTCGVNGVVDLSQMANMKEDPDLRRRGMWSLADLCAQVLDLDLAKPDALRKGSWEKRPLNVDQLFYAAADAYAGLRLWQVMQAMPDLTIQRPCPPSDARGVQSGGEGQRSGNGDTGGVSGAVTGDGMRDSPGEDGGHGCCSSRPAAATTDEESKATGGGRRARQVRLPVSKMETHRLWHEHGLSVEAVAEARRNKTSTILGYLADCIEAGLPYDWKRVNIASDTEKEIVRALLAVTDSNAAASAAAAAAAAAAASTPANDAAAMAAEAAAATTQEGGHADALPGGGSSSSSSSSCSNSNSNSSSAPASTPRDGAQVSTTCGHRPAGATAATADYLGDAIPVAPTEASGKRQRILGGSCASRGPDCVMTDGMSGENFSGRLQGLGVSVGAYPGEAGATTLRGSSSGVELSAAARGWESVGLREVKGLAPAVEYWQIRMVLARFRSGWCGCERSES